MKIQVVHLEAQDDVISTRDKMGWGQTSRIILILPDKGSILDRPLDLILLQRHSLSIGTQLSLVTRDEVINFHAAQLGIPTFYTLRKAQSARRGVGTTRRRQRPRRSRWALKFEPRARRSQADLIAWREQVRLRPPAWTVHPLTRWTAFAISLLALLVLSAALLPGASIELEPRQKTHSLVIPLTASVDFEQPRLTGELPARWVSVVVEGRETAPATGKMWAPEKTASGTVRFTNLTSQAVEIPSGTVVRTAGTNPVRAATLQGGRIAAGVGRYVELSVQVLSPGARGNVAARALQLVEGSLGLKASCTNPQPLRGGSNLQVTGPAELDRQKLLESLSKALSATAEQELKSTSAGILREGDFPILSSLKQVEVLAEKYQPEAGIPAEVLELTLRLEFQVLVVSGKDLQAVVDPILTASLPEGYSAVPDTQRVEPVRPPVMIGDAAARWQATTSQAIQAVIPTETVIQAVRGKPADQAAALLMAKFPLARSPEIHLVPAWWPYLPFVSARMGVK